MMLIPVTVLAATYSSQSPVSRGGLRYSLSGFSTITAVNRAWGNGGTEVYRVTGTSYTHDDGVPYVNAVNWLYQDWSTCLAEVEYGATTFQPLRNDAVYTDPIRTTGSTYTTELTVQTRHESAEDQLMHIGWDTCSSTTSVYVVLHAESARSIGLQEDVTLTDSDHGIVLPRYDLDEVIQTLSQDVFRSSANQLTQFDDHLIMSGQCPGITAEDGRLLFKKITEFEVANLRAGDCVPIYWISPDGSSVEVTILKGNDQLASLMLQKDLTMEGVDRWSVR